MKTVSRAKLARAFVALLDRYPLAPLSQALAACLVRQRRRQEIDHLLADIARQLLIQKRHLAAQIVTARPISAATLKEVESFLRQYNAATSVEIEPVVEPASLGGIVVNMPNGSLSWSLTSRINRLRSA